MVTGYYFQDVLVRLQGYMVIKKKNEIVNAL